MRKLTATVAGLTLMAFAGTAHAGIIDNGGFETTDGRTGIVNGNALNALGSSSPTWDVYSGLPGSSGDSWTTTVGPGIEVHYTGTVVPAFEGDHYVELDSDTASGPGDVGADTNSRMEQTVSLAGNTAYTLSFAYRPRTDQQNDNGIAFDIMNGVSVGSSVTGVGPQNWQIVTFDFTSGAAGAHTIGFQAIEADNTLGGFIDDIKVTRQVPEPATLGLMGAGIFGIGLAARRRRRKV